MTDWNTNKPPFDKKQDSLEQVKPSRVPGSPCQGSWRRRRLRGSLNVSFSPSASLTLGSSLVRGSRESETARLAEGTKRAKINPSHAPGSPCQGSWRRRRLRGSLNIPFSPSASLALSSSLVRGSRESENLSVA